MHFDRHLLLIVLALALAGAIYFSGISVYAQQHLVEFGYFGAFVIMLFSNATIFLPLPGLAAIVGLSAVPGINPILLGIASGIGGGIGEGTGYILGRGGENEIMKRTPALYKKVRDWMERHGVVTIVILGSIPNPAFDIVGIAAGALKYEWWKFMLAAIMGNVIKCALVASFSWAAAYYLWG